MSDRRSFLDRCVAASSRLGHQDGAYLAYHAERLYATWRVCRRLVPPGRSLLSIGAGSAFVEGVLAADGADVTVVDFAEGRPERWLLRSHRARGGGGRRR